jgi:hypothetical protein
MSTFKRIQMTPSNEARSAKLKAELRTEIAAKGDIHFRIDPETYLKLAHLATRKRMGIGVLARFWVMERLQQELEPIADHPQTFVELETLLNKCIKALHQVNRKPEVFDDKNKGPKLKRAKRA